jgi:DNA invertase Pin-like site-specific DNA recombinase
VGRPRVGAHLLDGGGSAIDTSSAMGKFFLIVMASASELEGNQISERTSAVVQHNLLLAKRRSKPGAAGKAFTYRAFVALVRRAFRSCRNRGPI